MALSRALKNGVALAVAALLVVGGGSVAFADQVWIDGDNLIPVDQNAAQVAACTDKPVDFAVLVGARRQGNANNNQTNNVFAGNSDVTLSGVVASAGMTTSWPGGDSVIRVATGWQGFATGTISSETLPLAVTLPAKAAGGTGSISLTYAGTNNAGQPVTGTASVTVTWTTKKCILDSTAPALALPANQTVEATSAAGATVTYAATAADETDPIPPTVGCTPASGSVFPLGTTPVSCSATDAAGNTATGSFNVIVRDTTAPAVGAMSNVAMEATGSGTVVTWTNPTATDAVAGSPAVTCSPASATAFAVGSTTVTCSATDTAGNTGSSTFSVVISDTTQPSLVVPAEFSVQATGPDGAEVTFATSATDLVDGAVPVVCEPASGSLLALGDTTVECAAADAEGNTANASFTVHVIDQVAPVVTVPTPIVLEATGPSGAVATFATSADDAVSGVRATTCVPASGSTFALGSTTVECTATDAAGNLGAASFSVTVQDTTLPVLTLPATTTAEATGPDGAAVSYTATASDLVSGSLTPSCVLASGATFGLGSHQVNCEVTDGAGNTATGSFAITVLDTTGPAITVPSTITEEATGPAGAVVTYDVTADDLVSGAATADCAPASGGTFPLGKTVVECSATDAEGNESNASFEIVVVDTTDPVVDVPDDIVEEATGPGGATVDFTASASDTVSGALVPTCAPPAGTVFGLGTTAVECTAVDGAANEGSASFDVTVRDTTEPIIHVPADKTVEATGPEGATVTFDAPATDIVDQDITTACSPASGSVFALGSTLVTCSGSDDSGNEGTATFHVVVQDTTTPIVHVPDTIVREATGPSGAVVGYDVTATDTVDQDVTPVCSPEAGSVFAIGTHVVGCTAADFSGNVGEGSFEVIVQDTTPPALTVPGDLTAEATGPDGAPVTYAATATDIVAGSVTPACTPASGSTFALGETTVTCVATDDDENSTTDTFIVTVQDTTAPAITVPVLAPVEATSAAGATVAYTATASDLVDGPVTPACTPASGSTFALGTTTVTCVAEDARGNADSETFTVSVIDTTKPVISWAGGPADGSSHVFGAVPAAATCTATDIVSGSVACQVTGHGTTVGSHTMTATATDGAGNTATASRSYSVSAWRLSGFFQPVDMGSVMNTVKGGSTVPLKFEVFAGSTELTATSAILSFVQKKVTCGTTVGTDDIEFTTTGGTALRYDTTGGQYIQNWQTPKLPGACYIVTMTTQDGSTISASFKLK
ncbi:MULTISPECIES: HYR domain-containing protein [Microbacterium]|uniref:HYR domain-containing protein n=1 Tax=Microbacterium TaxID=33882 RepID=UPI00146EE473|nr:MULTISPECIES: HYR domain-containing protein [Microbacterium]